jgi:CheY-like chemotaxis protein
MAQTLTQEQKLKLTQLRVLIVEDAAVDRLFLRSVLHKIGIQSIQEANNGTEGLLKTLSAREAESPFHVLITDWKMPRKDGIAFLKEVRSEKFKKPPYIIMSTSNAAQSGVIEAKLAGIDDYIVKPFNLTTLSEKILAALPKITI